MMRQCRMGVYCKGPWIRDRSRWTGMCCARWQTTVDFELRKLKYCESSLYLYYLHAKFGKSASAKTVDTVMT